MTKITQHHVIRTGFIAIALLMFLAAQAHAAEVAWGTYVGGSGEDRSDDIAVDANGNVYVTGRTLSSGWVSGGWDTTHGGTTYYDGYIVKLDGAGAHVWSTYLGGSDYDEGYGIAADANGNVYATGRTSSSGWVSGGWDTTLDGGAEGYIVKLDGAGGHVWSTYLGGSDNDYGYGIAADANGNVYATGRTSSSGWVSGGWDTTLSGTNDGYMVKLDGAGAHVWSTYLGGSSNDYGQGIAADANGNVYATGDTYSSGWVSGGWDTTLGGTRDGYIVKLDGAGAHVWSTYLGGSSGDYGIGIAADANGNVYAMGGTSSSGWVSGGWDTTFGGIHDGYMVKLDGAGAHVWTTYLGGSNFDMGYGIAADGNGNVYATGYTSSSGWVSGGWDTTLDGSSDGYIVKLDGAGAHVWSTYLGGSSTDYGYGIAADANGNVYATGETGSSGWVSGGWDTSYNGGYDGFVLKIAEPLYITSHPVGGSFYVGDSHTFVVDVSGGLPPLSYLWRHNGSDIGGATSSALVFEPLAAGDAGGYDCVVSDNGTDSVTSDVAALDVADHVNITTQPLSGTVMSGAAHVLFVEASGGYAPLWYAWSKDGSALSGATDSSYAIASFGLDDEGAYTVDVGDNLTDVMPSSPAVLTIEYPPMPITALAALASVCLLAGAVALRNKRL